MKNLIKNKFGFYQVKIKNIPKKDQLENYYHKINYQKRNMIKYYEKDKQYYLFYLDLLIEWAQKKIGRKIKKITDVGCGVGHLLEAAKKKNIKVEGLDISEDIISLLKKKKIKASLYNLNNHNKTIKTDVLVFKNIFEHINDPINTLNKIKVGFKFKYMIISTPNDFSKTQKIAMKYHKLKKPYWVDTFHHLSYFNFNNMENFLLKNGFKIIGRFSSFPLELISILGLPYIVNRKKYGRGAHKLRVSIEKNIALIDKNMLIEIYEIFSKYNIGRELFFIVKNENKNKS